MLKDAVDGDKERWWKLFDEDNDGHLLYVQKQEASASKMGETKKRQKNKSLWRVALDGGEVWLVSNLLDSYVPLSGKIYIFSLFLPDDDVRRRRKSADVTARNIGIIVVWCYAAPVRTLPLSTYSWGAV
jgi:hypothetical protein